MVPSATGMSAPVTALSSHSRSDLIHLGKLLHRSVEQGNQILAMDYNRDGSCFATAGKDFNVTFQKFDDNKPFL